MVEQETATSTLKHELLYYLSTSSITEVVKRGCSRYARR